VRDVTLSNSIFGNHMAAGRPLGVHALGGGIGRAWRRSASLAGVPAKTVALLGDGGTMVNLGEFATAVDIKADIVFVLMNDRGYGVIRNIQDAQFGGRRHYADLHTPDFGLLSAALGIKHQKVSRIDEFPPRSIALGRAVRSSSRSTWSRSARSRNPSRVRRRAPRAADEHAARQAQAAAAARRGRGFARPHHRRAARS
jgi:acetolactate synthase-1/2/3 large subunit